MEYGPRRLMHMVHLGLADLVLRSADLWTCVACYSCSARCPQGIQITDVIIALRNLAVSEGLAKDREATFSQAFVSVLARHGRMFEPEVLLRYYTTQANLMGLLKQARLGLRMFRKGKIGLKPVRIEAVKELSRIVASGAKRDRG